MDADYPAKGVSFARRNTVKELPLTEEEFRSSVSPSDMVRGLQGIGSPNPEEVTRMINQAKATLNEDEGWTRQREDALFEAEAQLNEVFSTYLQD